MSIEYGLVLTFFRRNSIFHIRFFLSRLPYLTPGKLKIIVGMSFLVLADKFFWCQKKHKKKIFNSKVAAYVLCPSFDCKLAHESEDITKNAWRTPLNAQCNIEYNILYFFLF